MKELSIEEKARRYDEALERARKCLDEKRDTCFVRPDVIFPELKESEDEKIKKSLIILLQHFCKGYRVPGLEFPVSYKDMLTWVENQGKQKTTGWTEEDERNIRDCIFYLKNAKKYFEKDDDILWNEKWFDSCIDWLEKQGQAKETAISQDNKTCKENDDSLTDEDEMIRKALIGIITNYVDNSNTFKPKMIAWLEKQGKQKPIDKLDPLIDEEIDLWIKENTDIHHNNNDIVELMRDMSYYVATLTRNLYRQKPKWNEEDEKNWLGIMDEIEANKSDAPDHDIETYDRFLYWLESLKQRMI